MKRKQRTGLRFLMSLMAAACLVVALTVGIVPQQAAAESVLRVNLDSSLKQLDPIWTTAYIVRSHGFLVYDTLFGLDENYNVQPQMVDTYTVSDDGMAYTFTLRDGLKWHDGTPVTSRDCVASIKRWGARDGMGQKLMEATDKLEVINDKTFRLELKERFGMVLQSLAKLTSNVPFMMKEEQALTDPHEQIKEVIGSGPFKFVKEEFQPGIKSVYVRNEDYVPRKEPASNTAGGKVPRVDRVEIVWIPDSSTQANALVAGEVDFLQVPALDYLPMLRKAKGVEVEVFDKLGLQCVLRMNWLNPPFDNVKARRAVLWATNLDTSLRAVAGNDPELFNACPSMYPCGTPYASDVGSEALMKQDFEKARQLLKEAGYKGDPVVILHATDDIIINNQCLVTAQNLRKAGFKVDMQAMDWSTLVARRAVKKPASEGGWNIFQTWFNGPDFLNPVEHMAIGGSCENAWFGWPCDKKIEELRTAFAR
ncbi:MAG: ABC transporter substrate-binding protein, partial [Deltaproteobacteria bacterium]|nr:ABC transporter substrate-binding protein [Deltaproteobacteria bacterium]